MNLVMLNKALALANKEGFGLDFYLINLDEVQSVYGEVIEFLNYVLEPILLDSSKVHGSSEHVSFKMPYSTGDVTGEFAFDKETEMFSYEAQDLDGKLYLIKWKA